MPEKAGGAGKFAIAQNTQNRDRQNGPCRPEQNRTEQQRRHDGPGNDAFYQFIM